MLVYVQPALLSTSVVTSKDQDHFDVTIWLPNEGIYARPHQLTVQLWSNFISPSWDAIDCYEAANHDVLNRPEGMEFRVFGVKIPLKDIADGFYEFTGRVKSSAEPWADWNWWNVAKRNGKVYIAHKPDTSNIMNKELSDVFHQRNVRVEDSIVKGDSKIWYITGMTEWNYGQASLINFGPIKNMIRYMALHRLSSHWLIPTIGADKLEISEKDVLYLLIHQSTGHYVLLIPMTFEDCTCTFSSDSEGNVILKVTNESSDDNMAGFIVGRGMDPYALTVSCANFAKQILGSNAENKTNEPSYYDRLGYCTWHAFLQKVNHKSVINTLQYLNDAKVPIGYIILDDGWQTYDEGDQRLLSFKANPEKFPEGLKELISTVKRQFPSLQHFGVWHTLWGYWNGVDDPLAQNYAVEKVKIENQFKYLVAADDVGKFYYDFYSFLKGQGVDMVKVDAQASFDLIGTEETKYRLLRNSYQNALRESSEAHFNSRVIYSMCHSPAVIYHQLASNRGKMVGSCQPLFRNSDDYSDSPDSHGWHIYANTLNNMWTRCLDCIPDWDMFQTHNALGDFHAGARAISGGPIYIADSPSERSNFDILKRLVARTPTTHTILRSTEAALPSLSCLFADATKEDMILKISNVNGRVGILGLFNCKPDSEISTFRLFDVYPPRNCNVEYVLFLFKTRTIRVVPTIDTQFSIFLMGHSFDIASFAPLDTTSYTPQLKIATFGLIDKYNGSRAIVSSAFHLENDVSFENKKSLFVYCVTLMAFGELGLYLSSSSTHPITTNDIQITVGDINPITITDFEYFSDSKLLSIQLNDIFLKPEHISNDDTFNVYIQTSM